MAAQLKDTSLAEMEMPRGVQVSQSDSFDGYSTAPDHEEDEWGYGPIGDAPEIRSESWHDPQAFESASNPSNLASWKADLIAHPTAQLEPTSGVGSRPFSSE
jgi:hypothetical protein